MGLGRRRVVDTDVAAVQLNAIQLLDGTGSVLDRAHGDEAKATRAVSLSSAG